MDTSISKRVRATLSNTWRKMVDRCENPESRDYKNYGGRGIRVWEGWLRPGTGKAEYIRYISESLPRPSGLTLEEALSGRGTARLTIDRIDNDDGYRPGNLRLATALEQSANQRRTIYVEIDGSRVPRTHAARRFGVDSRTAAHRARLGYSDSDAIRLGTGGRTAEVRRRRDELILAMIAGGDLFVDADGFIFVRDGDGWYLPPLATTGTGRYLGVSITVPARYSDALSGGAQQRGRRYRSTFQHARVVALFHLPRPADGQYYEVDHVNMDGLDDRPSNLRWRRPRDHRADAHKERPIAQRSAPDYAGTNAQANALKSLIAAQHATRPRATVLEEVPLPENLARDAVAKLVALVKADARHSKSLWTDPRYEALLPNVLAAAGNKALQLGGGLVECWPQTGGPPYVTHVTCLGSSSRVHFGCAKCGRQAFHHPTEIRNRVRYADTPCTSCAALDLVAPDLASLIAADPNTGFKSHPSRIAAGTNQYAYFRCRHTGCQNIVRRRVKSLTGRGELPVCTEHRRRGDNFNVG